MRAILAITGDWMRLVRDQKSFKILAWLTAIAGLLLACVKFDPRRIEILFFWDFELPSWSGDPENRFAPGNRFLHTTLSIYTSTLPWFAFLASIFATSGVVPDLLKKGRIDTILARPVTRTQFVAGSYLGGLVFVTLLAAILAGSSWLALALRGRVVSPAWFLVVPIVVGQYAILSSLLLFFGVSLRSGAGAAFLTLLFWFLGSVFAGLHEMRTGGRVKSAEEMQDFLQGPVGPFIDGLYYVLPKGGQLQNLTNGVLDLVTQRGMTRAIARSEEVESFLDTIDWPVFASTSLGLVALLLAWSALILRRRDL